MGVIVKIDLDPALLADYQWAAGERGRAVEAELADALAAMRPRARLSRNGLRELVRSNWARAPWSEGMSDSTSLIREDRDDR